MADKYNSVITNLGASYLLQNNVFSNGQFKIRKIEVCDKQIGDMIEAMSWSSMSEGNCTPVTIIEGFEEVNKVLRKVMIDEYTVQLRVNLGPEIGDFENPTNALSYGSVGVYLANYNTDGELDETSDILFMVGSLDTLFNKYMVSNLTAGNTVSFYLQAAVSNRPIIDLIEVNPTAYYSIPTVPTETDENEKLNPYYNLYGVWDYDESGMPALVFRNKAGDKWENFNSSLESAARSIAGGGIFCVESDNIETKLPYFEIGASGIITRLPPKTTIAFPKGLGKDSTFKTYKEYIELGLSTVEISGNGEWVVLLVKDEGNFVLQAVRAEEFSRDPIQPEDDMYWYDRFTNYTYRIESGVPVAYDFVEIARLKITDSKVDYFQPANVISSISQSDYNYIINRISNLESEARRIDGSVVHIEGEERISGQKTFLRDVILQSTEESETNLVLKTGVGSSTTESLEFKDDQDNEKAKILVALDEFGNSSLELSAFNATGDKSFLKLIDTSETGRNVVDASEDVKYGFTQSVVGYNHKNSDGTSRDISIEGKWNFAQDVNGQMFIGTAYRSIYGDLAELYKSDKNYKPGTLVKFGGEYEITEALDYPCGVISSNPGMLLNTDLDENDRYFLLPLALIGRVPVRVIGKINKFDRIVCSSIPGVAKKLSSNSEKVLGVALEDNSNDEEKLVLCAVQLKL